MSTFPARWDTAQQKPRGSGNEDANKLAAKKRDGLKCQRPSCPYCGNAVRGGGYLLHGAHWQAKGMGGDKRGVRSERRHFITLCGPSHAEQEVHDLLIIPLVADLLMDGPREWYRVENGEPLYEGVTAP